MKDMSIIGLKPKTTTNSTTGNHLCRIKEGIIDVSF